MSLSSALRRVAFAVPALKRGFAVQAVDSVETLQKVVDGASVRDGVGSLSLGDWGLASAVMQPLLRLAPVSPSPCHLSLVPSAEQDRGD